MSEFNKTVYKKDSKGKIRFLTVSSSNGTLIQESGILGGKSVVRESLCKAKNVGRSNETTPEEQARLEAASKIETKMSTGYFDSIEKAKGGEVILPMLAKSYDKEKRKVVFPCFVQPKLDGMRCLIEVKDGEVSMISRKGKVIDTLPHIVKAVKDSGFTDVVLDGELYVHGESFQKNISLIKKYRPGESERILFRWYDVVSTAPFEDRSFFVSTLLVGNPSEYISGVTTIPVKSEDDIRNFHGQFLEEGYEGTMVRWGDEGYKVNGRSSNLLKYKDFIDATGIVLDVRPSDRNPEQGVVVCQLVTDEELEDFHAGKPLLQTGNEFGCGMKFSHAEREEILTNKDEYIGQVAEIRFFEYTDDGLPRFPVCVGFRIDK